MATSELDLFTDAFTEAWNERVGDIFPIGRTMGLETEIAKEILKRAIEIRTGMTREELESTDA